MDVDVLDRGAVDSGPAHDARGDLVDPDQSGAEAKAIRVTTRTGRHARMFSAAGRYGGRTVRPRGDPRGGGLRSSNTVLAVKMALNARGKPM